MAASGSKKIDGKRKNRKEEPPALAEKGQKGLFQKENPPGSGNEGKPTK